MSKTQAWIDALIGQELSEDDECALWPFSMRKGYGVVRQSDKLRNAQHVIWEAYYRVPWPENMLALHAAGARRCSSTACVHPLHCVPGTEKENAADKLEDGTHSRGANSATAKLTEEQVLEIREKHSKGATQTALAGLYNVSRPTIADIVHGRSWWDTKPEARLAEVRAFKRKPLQVVPKGVVPAPQEQIDEHPKLTKEELSDVRRALESEMWGDEYAFCPQVLREYATWVTTPLEFREFADRKSWARAWGLPVSLLGFIEEHDEFNRLILETHKANGIPRQVINMAMEQLVAQATGSGASEKVIRLLLQQAGLLVAEKWQGQIGKGIEDMTEEEVAAELARINGMKDPSIGAIDVPPEGVSEIVV